MDMISIYKIIVPDKFIKSVPGKNKLNKVRRYVIEHGSLDSPVVLHNKTLVDGYIRYLVAVENGMDKVPYVNVMDGAYNNKAKNIRTAVFVIGEFKHGGKKYVWENRCGLGIHVGDRVWVETDDQVTNDTIGKITVTGMFVSSNPSMIGKHKSVITRAV